ncbi:MAG: endonuclease MutS2 [Candidatus Saccharibacteria bacterium]
MKNTLRRLEFNKINAMLAEEAAFYGGRELAKAITPSADIGLVKQRLEETTEALDLMRMQDTGFLTDLQDIKPYLAKAKASGILYPMDLLQVLQVLRASRMGKVFLAQGEGRQARELGRLLEPNAELEEKIRSAIDETGEVKDTASPELKALRSRMNTLRTRIKDYLRDFVKSPNNLKYLQDGVITERGGRYVVPVKQEHRHDIKGIVHDESASGATVFIEPEVVVQSNNEIRRLELEEKREIEKILRQLTAKVGIFADELQADLEALERLDFWLSKARLALKMGAYEPVLNNQGRIKLYGARHPLLGKNAVPIDIELGNAFNILVITGPNTGGKTVGLKTVGLLTIMAMCGLYIPAYRDSEISVFNEVLVDIGDEQSIEQSLSTFSSHMTNIIKILRKARATSLVILDELGAGTDPSEGGALARSILEKLLESSAKVIVSTHHSELKTFAYQYEKVENACVEFDPVSLRPTYRLTIGLPGQSNAFEIARKLGMDKQLVEKARQYIPQREIETAQMLRDLKELRFKTEAEQADAKNLRSKLLQEQEELARRRLQMEQEQTELLNSMKQEVNRYLSSVREEADLVLEELKERTREAEAPKWHELTEMRQKLKKAVPELKVKPKVEEPDEVQKLGPGAYVQIKSIGQTGYIVDGPSSTGDVTVQVGIMKLTVKQGDLIVKTSPDEKVSRVFHKSYMEKKKNVPTEIMLRGMLAEDALNEAERYIEEAFLAGLERVRIIHGKGTGTLRKLIREYLAKHPYVDKYREGEPGEGGQGVTVAYLKVR